MGPVVSLDFRHFRLRPFQTSHTFANLKRDRRCVFHVTDDVELIARAAVGRVEQPPPMRPVAKGEGFALVDACRWYALQVMSIDEQPMRASMPCRVVAAEFQREFFGLNRAKHAVVEAAILATRLHLLTTAELETEIQRLRPLVEKTGEQRELRAFAFLTSYVADRKQTCVGSNEQAGNERRDWENS